MEIYIVQPGDSLYSIAQTYGVPVDQLIADNTIQDSQRLMIGQALVIKADSIPHTVQKGESLYSIARRYHTTIDTIQNTNQLIDPSNIQIGQVITVPLQKSNMGTIVVNGFVLPDIDDETLQKTLPHLTFISIFSYLIRPDGSLILIQDDKIVEAARAEKVAPLMVINNMIEGEGFNSDLAHTILYDEKVQNALIEHVLQTLPKGYYGINIDFEYVYPNDRDAYNRFLQKITGIMHTNGYIVTTSLAPKTSGNQAGLLYTAHEYPYHGQTVDYIILMTYEWGYIFGPAMAVAPSDQVEKVLQYATSVIPSQKILMGIPNYGYDWTLPFAKGSMAESLSNTELVNRAGEVGVEIYYDTKVQAPFYRYYDDRRREHVVWFEDARSIRAKLELVHEYHLGGISYWTLNSFFPQNWLVLESMYTVKKVL